MGECSRGYLRDMLGVKPTAHAEFMVEGHLCTLPKCPALSPTWAPRVCRIIAFMAVIMGLGLLFHILTGFR